MVALVDLHRAGDRPCDPDYRSARIMTAARFAGIALIASAVAAGTLLDVRRPRQIPRHGEYSVLQADFHVHAALGDGGVAPWELRREAERRGLDVIAVTNHNQL